jgi:uncharacterized repeat protein (TIGR01451 family)
MNKLVEYFQKITHWFVAFLLVFNTNWWFSPMPVARAHSVGQVQTQTYFAPETIDLILSRAGTGLQVGDNANYIIQFTPVANGATTGAGGYITAYIPAGTEVVGASIVTPSGTSFAEIPPDLPGTIDEGWGKGEQTWSGPIFTNNNYINTTVPNRNLSGKCSGATAAKCNGTLAQVYADTGIFYSTDTRTKYTETDSDGRITQLDGYEVDPTAEAALIAIIGTTKATTHNLWDANQNNAFGAKTIAPLSSPPTPANTAPLVNPNQGRGTTPLGVGSAVAGPLTGYPLDNTGAVGPWQRISYLGSRTLTDAQVCRATAASTSTCNTTANAQAVAGSYTNDGYSLSSSNPLPSNTNTVRWAIGKLLVGRVYYVKLNLRLTALPPAGGIILNTEVFGGDAAGANDGHDSVWRYHVPSVASARADLAVSKELVAVNGQPYSGGGIPVNATVRYRVTYVNASSTIINAQLSDTLPSSATNLANVTTTNGLAIQPINQSVTGGSTIPFNFCSNPPTCTTYSNQLSLGAGQGGQFEFDVQTTAVAGTNLTNEVKLQNVNDPTQSGTGKSIVGVVSGTSLTANLQVSKTIAQSNARPDDIVDYTITIANNGFNNATSIVISDFLPSDGGTTDDATKRFNYVSNSSTVTLIPATGASSTIVPTSINSPSTATATAPYAGKNRQEVKWTLPTTLAQGTKIQIAFKAKVGINIPIPLDYTNDVKVSYNDGLNNVFAYANNQASISIDKSPVLFLLKRITSINNASGATIGGNNMNQFNDDGIANNQDNNPLWPPVNNYLKGAIDGGVVANNDLVDFTIYFLETDSKATNVTICDLVPQNMTFIADSFATGKGLALALSNSSLPTAPTAYFTNNIADNDGGAYYPLGSVPPTSCKKPDPNNAGNFIPMTTGDNNNGLVAIDVVKSPVYLPKAVSSGNPTDSFGFIRFRAKVN